MKSRVASAAAFAVSVFLLSMLAVGISSGPAKAEPIRGAGSTFAAPIIQKWSQNYRAARADGGEFVSSDWRVDYELLGSLAGVMRLAQPEMDFAASDQPLPPADLARLGYAQFPIVIGGVAVVANLEGIAPGQLRLSGSVLAEIYLGRIGNWSDPAIAALNPEVRLPDLPIRVMHRRDGSGTTFTFTQYLSNSNGNWKLRFGADTTIAWPTGQGFEGTQGLIGQLRATRGAIGYVEYGQVRRAGLPFVQVDNWTGRFVRPEAATFQATANAANWRAARDFYLHLTDVTSEDGYPITAATFAIVPRTPRSASRARSVVQLFQLAFDEGSADAIALGYVPLPAALVQQIRAFWRTELGLSPRS
mgnify:CR=1 FL=1